MNFKKMLSIIIVAVLCLTLFSSCGENKNNGNTTTTTESTVVAGKTIAFVSGSDSMGFYNNLKKGAEDAAKKYGDQCVVLSVDVKRVDGKFMVFAKGGRENTGMEALSWIKRCVDMGAGEVVVNSIDTDGVKEGFDLELLKQVCELVNVPVIASGGAGCKEDFITLFNTLPKVDAGLAASIFHFGQVQIPDLKAYLAKNNINVRL